MKMRKATAGEKIIVSVGYTDSLHTLRVSKALPQHRDAARRIDALVRRAVREAWRAHGEYSKAIAIDRAGWDIIRKRIERKYRVKL